MEYAVNMAEADYFGDGELFLHDSEEPPDVELSVSYSAYVLDAKSKNKPWVPMEFWQEFNTNKTSGSCKETR